MTGVGIAIVILTSLFAGGALVMWAAVAASEDGMAGTADHLGMHPAAAMVLIAVSWPWFVWRALVGGLRVPVRIAPPPVQHPVPDAAEQAAARDLMRERAELDAMNAEFDAAWVHLCDALREQGPHAVEAKVVVLSVAHAMQNRLLDEFVAAVAARDADGIRAALETFQRDAASRAAARASREVPPLPGTVAHAEEAS